MKTWMLAAALCAASLATSAASAANAPSVALHGTTFSTEFAVSDAEREHGLMDRTHMDADHGMLFIFPGDEPRSFWMKNTLIPLDLIFVAEDGRVTGVVARATPGDLTPRSAGGPSRYVLEVNGGWAEARGVAAGDRVRFENVPRF